MPIIKRQTDQIAIGTERESGGNKLTRLVIDAQVLDLDELTREYEIEDLEYRLQEWEIYPIHDAGQKWIRVTDWREFVGNIARRVEELVAERSAGFLEVQEQERYESVSNQRATRTLARHPSLRTLLDDFAEYIKNKESARVKLKPRGQTVTFFGPDGLKAGLRLRPGRGNVEPRLWLVGSRAVEGSVKKPQFQFSVRTSADFDRARQFLVGDWQGEPMEEPTAVESAKAAQESAPE